MDIKIEGFYADDNEYYQASLNLRQTIFVEELGFDKHLEFDGIDQKATHYILFLDGKPAGCARWIEGSDKLKLDRFGIHKSYRHYGLGILLIKFILSEIEIVKKRVEVLSTNESIVFFVQHGFKDSETIEDFGTKKLNILNLIK